MLSGRTRRRLSTTVLSTSPADARADASLRRNARFPVSAAVLVFSALSLAAPAQAQEPAPTSPPVIQAQPLRGLDLFQAGAGATGLAPDLWRGTSAALARDVFDRLGDKPLSPAARRTALALLRTSAAAPDGAAADAELAGARVRALLALGDPAGVDAILDRTSGVAGNAALSQAAAEANLYLGQDEESCRLGQETRDGRDQPFFVRLRAYCDAVAGRTAQAQLALSLVEQGAGRDTTFARLLGALLAGEGASPGAASLQTALHTALSRRLGLDLAPAVPKASPAAVAALAAAPPEGLRETIAARARALGLSEPDAPTIEAADDFGAALAEAVTALRGGGEVSSDLVDRFARLAPAGGRTIKPRAQAAALLLAAAGAGAPAEHRLDMLRYDAGAADAAGARRLGLDLAADAGRFGETALIALDIALGAGASGPKLADRLEIVRALREAQQDRGRPARTPGEPLWRAWVLEGLAQLAAPPPAASR